MRVGEDQSGWSYIVHVWVAGYGMCCLFNELWCLSAWFVFMPLLVASMVELILPGQTSQLQW